MNRRFITFVLILGLVFSNMLLPSKSQARSPKHTVYVTTYALEFFTEALAGDLVDVKNFVPPAADLHSWEPTARDMAELSEASLLIANGAGLEPWLDKVTVVLDEAKVIDSSTHVDLLPSIDNSEHDDHDDLGDADDHDSADHDGADHDGDDHDADDHDADDHNHDADDHDHHHDHGAYDPHFWVDPHCAEEQAKAVYEALLNLLPEDEDTLKANYEALEEKFEALQDKADQLDDGPGKAFVVTHGGFRYLSERYDLEQLALNVADHSEPPPRELAIIIERAKELGLKTVLFDSSDSSKQAEVIAEAISGEIVPIQTFEYVSEEARTDGRDYFDRMTDMLETLQAALGGYDD